MGEEQSVSILMRLNPATLLARPLPRAVTAVKIPERDPKVFATGHRFAGHLSQSADGRVETVFQDAWGLLSTFQEPLSGTEERLSTRSAAVRPDVPDERSQ